MFLHAFTDLEKAFDQVPRDKLWRVLEEFDIDGGLLKVIKSLRSQPEACVRENSKRSKSFHVGVGLQQGCG